MPAPVALLLMIAVTAWNGWMALTQDAELLAAYAIAGGFATPALLSTGGNHEIFLFTYVLALAFATVILVRIKGWPRLLLGAFPMTMSFFIGWYSQFFHADEFAVTTLFILLFAGAFASVAVRRTPLPEGTATRLGDLLEDVLLPLANAAFLALALFCVLQDSGHHDLLPWMMILLAAVYLGFMRLPQSRTASAIHLSIAIAFLTIAVPLKASGHWITTTWLVESLILLWVATRLLPTAGSTSKPEEHYTTRVLQLLSAAALSLGLCGIFYHLYNPGEPTNEALPLTDLATALLGLGVLGGVIALCLRTERSDSEQPFWATCAAASTIAFNVVAILTGIREISGWWSASAAESALQQSLAISAFLMLYGAALLALGFYRRSAFLRWQALLLLIAAILKAFVYDMRNLSQGYRVASFLGLGALLMAISFAYQKDWLALRDPSPTEDPDDAGSPPNPVAPCQTVSPSDVGFFTPPPRATRTSVRR